MHATQSTPGLTKTGIFAELRQQLEGLVQGERDALPNCANAAALIYHALPDVNWAGFYFLRDGELVLGPFQGKAACVRIELGKGVCGTTPHPPETLVVADVHAFPGHIACDAASRSEIVIPLIQSGRLLGVLDIDSPLLDRFDREDAQGLDALLGVLLEASDFDGLAIP
jgi:L-methionine (R)-S-oxide reductase